jgi:DNA primase
MAEYIPEHKIDEIRNTVNIVEIVSTYVNLTKAGSVFRGLCPFHNEKTPSFTVNPERRIFHCFGCGVGGNVFRFLMLQKGVSFPEAVSELADKYGIELPKVEPGVYRQRQHQKVSLYRVNELAQKFFEEELNAEGGRVARAYLEKRGLRPDIIQEYHLGWAPPGWDNLRRFLESRRVPVDVMEEAGLVRKRDRSSQTYDTFRARIICPIFDLDGKTVAFGGRLLQEEERQPKYLNSPETPIYSKGRLLYGLDRHRQWLRQKKTALIVEGYFDLLSLAAHGVKHVVATLGTALTASHLRLLKGYVDQALLVFDADEAGRAAAARALPLFLSADLDGRVLRLPEGHDPDTFVRAFGPKVLEAESRQAVGLLDYYLDQTLARFPATLSGKGRAAQEIMGVITRVEGQTRQNLLRHALADRLGISEQALLLTERRAAPKSGASEAESASGLVGELETDFEIGLLQLVLLHPETAPIVFEAKLGPLFDDTTARKIYDGMALIHAQNGRVEVDRLIEQLDQEEADLVTGLALSDNGLAGQELATIAMDFVQRFVARQRRAQTARLSQQIKQAQANGDDELVADLLLEKNQLLRENKL